MSGFWPRFKMRFGTRLGWMLAAALSASSIATAQIQLPSETLLANSRPAGPPTQRIAGAFGGGRYLLVWSDERNSATTEADIYGQFVTPEGQLIGQDFRICDFVGRQSESAVAFNGQSFWVAWTDERLGPGVAEIFLARVALDGTVLPLQGFQAAPSIGPRYIPALACSLSDCVVTWSEVPDAFGYRLVGNRLASDGTILATSVPMSADPREKFFPGLVGVQPTNRYALFWLDNSRAAPVLDFRTQTYSSDLTPLGTPITPGVGIQPGISVIRGPRTTSSPGVGWAAYPVFGSGPESAVHILGMNTQTLTVSSPLEVARDPLGASNPAVAFDGQVIWVAYDRGVTPTRRRVEILRVGTDGTLQDATPAWTANNTDTTELPALTPDSSGHVLLAYIAHGASGSRVAIRNVAQVAGTTCSDDLSCQSGSCLNGICAAFPLVGHFYRVAGACGASGGDVTAPMEWFLVGFLLLGLRAAKTRRA